MSWDTDLDVVIVAKEEDGDKLREYIGKINSAPVGSPEYLYAVTEGLPIEQVKFGDEFHFDGYIAFVAWYYSLKGEGSGALEDIKGHVTQSGWSMYVTSWDDTNNVNIPRLPGISEKVGDFNLQKFLTSRQHVELMEWGMKYVTESDAQDCQEEYGRLLDDHQFSEHLCAFTPEEKGVPLVYIAREAKKPTSTRLLDVWLKKEALGVE